MLAVALDRVRSLGDRLDASPALDRLAEPLQRGLGRLLPGGRLKDGLHGVWLGHPLHPVLTDLPIGFWTSSSVFDLFGGRRARRAAELMVGLGVASAVPTIAAGAADWSELNRPEQRSGAVHAVSNIVATVLYGASFLSRRTGRHRAGVALGAAGATAATIGGFLGGHLSYSRAAGVNRAVDAPSTTQWGELVLEGTVQRDRPVLARLDGAPLAVVGTDGAPVALYARCSHLGGPLEDGEVVGGCVRCPWHRSEFRLADGSVVHGPATSVQPAYELTERDGVALARRRPAAGERSSVERRGQR